MGDVILYVHDLRSSGVVRNAIAYADRLAVSHRTTLIAGCGEGMFRDAAADGRFALKLLGDRPAPLPRVAAALRLRRWLRSQAPCVLLSVGNLGHPTCYWATRGLSHVRRVYRISNGVERGDGARSAIRAGWMGMLVRDASRIALVGTAHRQVPAFARALAEGIAVEIPNGIDRQTACTLAGGPVPHPWLQEPVPVVLAIGRLRPQKNFDLLIDAAGRARHRRRLRLILIGAGTEDERARLSTLAATTGLGEDFLLAGETGNVFPWLRHASVFALPSRWEGSSMALIEALAVETPVVASRLAGDAADVLGEGRDGLLFDGHDADALADALLAQIDHPIRPGQRADQFVASADAYARLVEPWLADSWLRTRQTHFAPDRTA